MPWESEHQESPEDHKSPEDYKSLEDYKKHRETQDHEESRKPQNPGSQESGKSTRVKKDCQVSRIQNFESGRLADSKRQDPGE
jgi:hypothetical protein